MGIKSFSHFPQFLLPDRDFLLYIIVLSLIESKVTEFVSPLQKLLHYLLFIILRCVDPEDDSLQHFVIILQISAFRFVERVERICQRNTIFLLVFPGFQFAMILLCAKSFRNIYVINIILI